MARIPLVVPLPMQQNADFRRRFRLPIDGTSITVYASVYNRAGTEKLLDLTVDWITRSATDEDDDPYCEFYLTATYTETALLTTDAAWDLLVVSPTSPEREYWLEGPVPVSTNNTVP